MNTIRTTWPLAILTLAAIAVLGLGSPPIALAIGAGIGLLATVPLPRLVPKLAKILLQASVVLLGFGIDLPVVLRAGASGFGLAAGSIAITLLLGTFLTHRLKLPLMAGTLITAGTAICGGSAIAAVGSAIEADEGDMTVAMGTVFVLNAVALIVFPTIGHAAGLTQHQFGVWSGVAIQDVSSTVAAAAKYGPEALQTATAVKLSRALWIVPVVLAIAWRFTPTKPLPVGNSDFGFATAPRPRKLHVPWFIGLFLLASVAGTAASPIRAAAPAITHLATLGLTLTLLLIGTGVNRKLLRAVGWRSLLLGVVLWVVLSVGGLLIVSRFC